MSLNICVEAEFTRERPEGRSRKLDALFHADPQTDKQKEIRLSEDTSDESLLSAYRDKKDQEAFTLLLGRIRGQLFSYLRHYLQDAILAEDALQIATWHMAQRADQFEDGRKARSWIYAIATNAAIDIQRKERRHTRLSLDEIRVDTEECSGNLYGVLEDPSATALSQLLQHEDCTLLHEDIRRLSFPLRQVVDLLFFQDMKYREAADTVGIPIGTVKSRVHKALIMLFEFQRVRNQQSEHHQGDPPRAAQHAHRNRTVLTLDASPSHPGTPGRSRVNAELAPTRRGGSSNPLRRFLPPRSGAQSPD